MTSNIATTTVHQKKKYSYYYFFSDGVCTEQKHINQRHQALEFEPTM